jgi:hypothetical protein
MADSLLGLAAGSFWFWFCVLVLAAQPQRAHGQNKGVVAPSEAGICASLVTVYGYKCQELEVRNSKKTVSLFKKKNCLVSYIYSLNSFIYD